MIDGVPARRVESWRRVDHPVPNSLLRDGRLLTHYSLLLKVLVTGLEKVKQDELF